MQFESNFHFRRHILQTWTMTFLWFHISKHVNICKILGTRFTSSTNEPSQMTNTWCVVFPFVLFSSFFVWRAFRYKPCTEKEARVKKMTKNPFIKPATFSTTVPIFGITSHNQLNAMVQSVLSAAGVVWARIYPSSRSRNSSQWRTVGCSILTKSNDTVALMTLCLTWLCRSEACRKFGGLYNWCIKCWYLLKQGTGLRKITLQQ